ncbi:MAG TPA: TonB-dependent receptor [Terracidiphilus sp.]
MRRTVAIFLLLIGLWAPQRAAAQSTNGIISGIVFDPGGKAIPGAQILIINDATRIAYSGETNSEGIYALPSLPPGPYRIQVAKSGFKTVIKPDIVLNVQDSLSINFTLPLGAVTEVVTIEGGAPLVDTQDATVSTIIDRQFAENLPMNGRSFQTLIQLAPGVVVTPSNEADSGQFSVNGQRGASNYWMVDGVSANFGIGVNTGATGGNGLGGALGSFNVTGGTNSLVSVDALQEFRILTSTYAPEFGRTPGGQISIVTRSGTNQFHGTAFDYFRNDALDASNWFNGYVNNPPLPKAEERQNDFGGTFAGPILKNRAFFFFSYEGLRLRLPQTTLTTVPDLAARQNASSQLQPYFNAFPLPNGPEVSTSPGSSDFNASYSNPASLDATGLRIDRKVGDRLVLFGRYVYSPSQAAQRGFGEALTSVESTKITTQTATSGATWMLSDTTSNDLRFNYSRSNAYGRYDLDAFGGAVPLSTLPFPSPFTSQDGLFNFNILSLQGGGLLDGKIAHNLQQQINVVDSLSTQKGPHTLKFGADYRRLSPLASPDGYLQDVFFQNMPGAESGNMFFGLTAANLDVTFLFRDLGVYAQDTWRVKPHLTMTYGLRWDVDFALGTINGPHFPALVGFDLSNLSNLALAPAGTSPYKTAYGNVAPRLGIAYQLFQRAGWQTVLHGGFGVFYDLATSEMGNLLGQSVYPFGAGGSASGTFPLSPAMAAAPSITPPNATNGGGLFGVDPHLRLPYSLEWNASLEQGLGEQETVTVSYVGAAGRRLLQTASVLDPNPNLSKATLVTNEGSSDYNALQIQFQRRMKQGLQLLASYTWSHSLDTGSAGSIYDAPNALVPSAAHTNRGPSDFDIRNAVSMGLTYDLPKPRRNGLPRALLGGWSVDSIVQARSAPPVTVDGYEIGGVFVGESIGGFYTLLRPDLVPGEPLYLRGSQFPGKRAFNRAAFMAPPMDPATGQYVQGDLGRNALRGFGATQWDFSIHREFPIREPIKLQFRAEMFNLPNHPNFGQPDGLLSDPTFGESTQTLGASLNRSNLGSGAFNPLYQIGGPRSIQLAMKLSF